MSCKTIYVMISSFLSEEEKMIVAAHELGHIILHRSQLKMAPMQDDTLYNMTDNTEYQANLFAADLLIEDEKIEDMVQNEDLDYFGLCSSLNATPELMSFKLYSLTKRGQAYHMPMEIQSNFPASYSGFNLFRPPPGFLVFFILLMQLQRQSIRVMEESHLLACIIVNTDWLTFNANFRQFSDRLFHAINAERKVT